MRPDDGGEEEEEDRSESDISVLTVGEVEVTNWNLEFVLD